MVDISPLNQYQFNSCSKRNKVLNNSVKQFYPISQTNYFQDFKMDSINLDMSFIIMDSNNQFQIHIKVLNIYKEVDVVVGNLFEDKSEIYLTRDPGGIMKTTSCFRGITSKSQMKWCFQYLKKNDANMDMCIVFMDGNDFQTHNKVLII